MMTLSTLTSVFELLTATRERVEAEGVLEGSAGSWTDGQRADLRRPGAGAAGTSGGAGAGPRQTAAGAGASRAAEAVGSCW